MDNEGSRRILFGLGLVLILLPLSARADFIIEFASGRHVTVDRYVDEGRTLKVYTSTGMIGFRKADVKQITDVGASRGFRGPLGESVGRPAVSKRTTTPDVAEGQPAQAGAEKTGDAGQNDEAQKEPLTPEQIAQIDQHYQQVDRNFNNLWTQHVQQVNAGASNEELAENRQLLLALDEERRQLQKKIQEEARREDFPEWAR